VLAVSLSAAEPSPQPSKNISKPNIILIMSDDMGYSDIGCYGGEIQTPNLNRLAKNGVRFTQFYNTARCCPTRASLLTGLYPHQAGIGHMMEDRGHDGYRGQLNQNSMTIAEVLKLNGYHTSMCGKWHVTRHTGPDGNKSAWPLQRGFDNFYGTITGAGSFYDPSTLCRQNQLITPENDEAYQPNTYYYTDAISDNAVNFLQQHHETASEQPFFLYTAYTAAHWPMHALEKDIQKYKGRYDAGYDAIRAERLERLKQLGFINADIAPANTTNNWQDVSNKAWEARSMEVYAAMIDSMDQGIGRIIDQLEATGELENTLIFFLQDNGGCAEGIGRNDNGPGPDNLKPFGPDGLQPRITPPMQTRDGRWVRTGPQIMPGPEDSYVAYGRGWANVSNTPFREFKHWTHEGGISTPLIVHWPLGFAADAATDKRPRTLQQPSHLIDIMATCVDVSGAEYPAEFNGNEVHAMEGLSLQPLLNGKGSNSGAEAFAGRTIYWEHEGNRAVRRGHLKLVAKEDQPWELYDISKDRGEQNNLASTQSETVATMSAAWDAWAGRANVLPLGTWKKAQTGAR
jgi:arylsulfatase A-like enzyme